jgi:hypothetical protein
MFYNVRMDKTKSEKWSEYYAKKREHILDMRKKRYQENHAKELEQCRVYRETHRNETRACQKKYKDKNRVRLKAYYREKKAIIIAAYGGHCECCGDSHFEFLTIDHINGGGTQDRKKRAGSAFYARLEKLGFPKDKYRLLCMNCNFALGKYGHCPHKLLTEPCLP